MKRTPVSSTLLNSIGYDADKQVLEVEFKNGGLYTYSGVTEEEHENLMSAPSVGGHFAAQIQRNHPFNCLRGGGPVSNLIDHAKREFEISGYIPVGQEQEDGPNKWIQENVMQLLKVFADQGHSGSSAPYCVSMFEKLAMFEPLTPLTGDDSEWAEVSEGVFQNKRCSHVFKQADRFDGQAYDLEGKIFRDPGGGWYTNYHSAVPVEFPYYPEPVYVDETEDQHE